MLHELPDLVLLAAAAALVGAASWAALAPRSRVADWIAWASRIAGGAVPLAVMLLSGLIFIAVAEDVVRREADDWVVLLDREVQQIGTPLGRDPQMHAAARTVSNSAGYGLAIGVAFTAAALAYAGPRRAAAVLILGTGGAWLLQILVKVGLGVQRPSLRPVEAVTRGYGFPSGHTMVTLVALGLVVWLCSREASRWTRASLYAASVLAAGLVGAARVLLHAHWMSDVVGGLALGAVYVVVVTAVAERAEVVYPAPTTRFS